MRHLSIIAALAVALVGVCPAHATLTSTTNTVSYSCNGSTTAYSITFPFQSTSHVRARVYTGTTLTTTLALTTDYAVTPSSSSSTGTLTLVAGSRCANGKTLKIDRYLPLTQPTSLRTQGRYDPATHETAWDRLTMQIQQVAAGASTSSSTVTTTAPITGDGSSGAPVGCTTATGSVAGCVSSTDWNTFNNKAGLGANTFTGKQTVTIGSGNTDAIGATGHGSGAGITATGGATGAGVVGVGGATSGAGGTFTASAGNSAGIVATGNGTGADVSANTIDTKSATMMTIGSTATRINLGGAGLGDVVAAGGLKVGGPGAYGIQTTTVGAALDIGTTTANVITLGTVAVKVPGGVNATAGADALDTIAAGALNIGTANATSVVVTPPTTLSSTKNRGTCTLNGGSPSTCTATVTASSICVATVQGTTAAAALHTVAVSLSATTLTITGANALTDVVNYHCL